MSVNGQMETNNVSASDSSKVDQINALIGGGPTPEEVEKKQPSKSESSDSSDPGQTSDSNDQLQPDPELAFDTDQQPQDAAQDKDDDPESGTLAQDEVEKPVSLADLAETLEVDSKDLYDVEIPIHCTIFFN